MENHPDVIERLREWAVDKPNVIIIEGVIVAPVAGSPISDELSYVGVHGVHLAVDPVPQNLEFYQQFLCLSWYYSPS